MPDLMTQKQRASWKRLTAAGRARAAKLLKDAGLDIPYQPGADNVLVMRLPAPPVEKVTAGGLHIPEKFQEEPEPKSEGFILEAGPQALDVFLDHGYFIGDKVQIGRFAGWEKEFELDAKGDNRRKVLQMKAGDVLGSFDLKERLWGAKPTMELVLDDQTEEHVIRIL